MMPHNIVVETYKTSNHIGNHNTVHFQKEVYGAYSHEECALLNQILYTLKFIVFALMRRTYRTNQNTLRIFLKTSATVHSNIHFTYEDIYALATYC